AEADSKVATRTRATFRCGILLSPQPMPLADPICSQTAHHSHFVEGCSPFSRGTCFWLFLPSAIALGGGPGRAWPRLIASPFAMRAATQRLAVAGGLLSDPTAGGAISRKWSRAVAIRSAVRAAAPVGRVLINAADVGFWGRSGNLVLDQGTIHRTCLSVLVTD